MGRDSAKNIRKYLIGSSGQVNAEIVKPWDDAIIERLLMAKRAIDEQKIPRRIVEKWGDSE